MFIPLRVLLTPLWLCLGIVYGLNGPALAKAIPERPAPLLQLHAAFTHPSSSGFVLDGRQAYFSSADGQQRLFLEAWPTWPMDNDGPSVAIHDLAALPSMLRLRWFSATDDQFWSAYVALPKQRLRHYINKSLIETALPEAERHGDQLKSVFNRLIVTVKDEGKVTVWLGNEDYEIQITDAIQARKVDVDWTAFTATWPLSQQGLSRAQWVEQIRSADDRHYYNLRFARLYGGDEPAVDVDYAVYTINKAHMVFYCGRTDEHGHTREFIGFNEAQDYVMIDNHNDQSICPILSTLDEDLPAETSSLWPMLKH